MKRPFLTVGLSMLCTMFLLFAIGTLYTLILLVLALAIVSVFIFLRHREATVAMLAGIAALLAVSSFSYTQDCLINTALLYCGENIFVSGTLADYPEPHNGRYVYRLQNCIIGETQTDFSLNLSDEVSHACAPGDVFQFTAQKIYPSAEKDSEYYYSTMADRVYLRAYTEQITITKAEARSLKYLPCELRHTMLTIFGDRLKSDHAAILGGLMLGNTDSFDTKTALLFSTLGISHLFAVSGFHISFWTGMLLHLFGRRKRHILSGLLACAFLFFFMALTGFSASVCRSGLMTGLVFLGYIFRKPADSMNSLGFALTVLLTINPFSAATPSLLLSAAATAAIILASRPIEDYITQPATQKIPSKTLRKYTQAGITLLCLSAAVTLSLLPLTSFLFGSVSMLTPLANILCVPSAQTAMMIGIAAQISNPIPYFSDFLFRLTEICLDILLFFANNLAKIPISITIHNTVFTVVWTAVSFLLVGIVYKKYNRKPRRAFFTALCSALSLMILFNILCYTNKDQTVLTVHNAGNASCITLRDHNGNAAIIGCGGDDYLVESLARQLRSGGVLQPRLLLIPDTNETEDANAWDLNRLLEPEYIITKQWDASKEENIVVTDEAQVQLWEGTSLRFTCVEDFRAVHLQTNGKNIVICVYPSSDFSDADSEYQSGDILICRQSIPPTVDTDKFGQIILSSDKEKELYYFDSPLADKTTTTADEGSIKILIG